MLIGSGNKEIGQWSLKLRVTAKALYITKNFVAQNKFEFDEIISNRSFNAQGCRPMIKRFY